MQPALDGSDWQRQGLRRQLLALALQVAEDDQDAITLGEPVDFLVEDRACLGSCSGDSRRAVLDSAALRSKARRRRATPGPERPAAWPRGAARGRASRGPRGRGLSGGAPERSPGRHPGRRGGCEGGPAQTRRTMGPWRSTSAVKASSASLGFGRGEPFEQLAVGKVADRPQLDRGCESCPAANCCRIATLRRPRSRCLPVVDL